MFYYYINHFLFWKCILTAKNSRLSVTHVRSGYIPRVKCYFRPDFFLTIIQKPACQELPGTFLKPPTFRCFAFTRICDRTAASFIKRGEDTGQETCTFFLLMSVCF